jgi:hypothetical protein
MVKILVNNQLKQLVQTKEEKKIAVQYLCLGRLGFLESISPTFYKCTWSDILVPIKSLTFTASTKKLCAKLLNEKAACKMLVKLTPGTHGSKM